MKHPSLHSLKLAVCLCSCSMLALPSAIYAQDQDSSSQNAPAQEAASGQITVMTEADYPALLCGSLTQSELEVLLAYTLGEGIPDIDVYTINFICGSAGWMTDGGVAQLGSTADYRSIFSVSDVNRFLSAFSDYQLSESNHVSDQFIVSGNQLIFAPASLSDTCEATITHGEYDGQTMKVNYTRTLVDSPDADMGLPVGIPFEKTATLKITPEGRYRIMDISDGTQTLADDAAAGAATTTSMAATTEVAGTTSTGSAASSAGTSEKITIPAEAAGLYADTLQRCYDLYLAHCNGTADLTTDEVEGVPQNLAGTMRLVRTREYDIYKEMLSATFTDVDSDGIPELILGLGVTDGSSYGTITDVCTVRDGQTAVLADDTWTFTGSSVWTYMDILENGGLAVHDHEGNGYESITWKKLSEDGSGYEYADCVFTEPDYTIGALVYYHGNWFDGDKSHPISEAQFNEIQNQYAQQYPDPHLEYTLRAVTPDFISEVRAGEVHISSSGEDNGATTVSSDVNAASATGSAETAGATADQPAGTDQTTGTIEIPGDLFADGQPRLTSDGHILPGCDSRYLTQDDLAGLSQKGLNYAINEFYARHGRQFVASELRAYFGSMPWYSGTIPGDQFSDSVFNDYEHANLVLCAQYQNVIGVYSPQ